MDIGLNILEKKRKYDSVDSGTTIGSGNGEDNRKLLAKLWRLRPTSEENSRSKSSENVDDEYLTNTVDKRQKESKRPKYGFLYTIDGFSTVDQLDSWAENHGLINDDLVNLRRIQLLCDEIIHRDVRELSDVENVSGDFSRVSNDVSIKCVANDFQPTFSINERRITGKADKGSEDVQPYSSFESRGRIFSENEHHFGDHFTVINTDTDNIETEDGFIDENESESHAANSTPQTIERLTELDGFPDVLVSKMKVSKLNQNQSIPESTSRILKLISINVGGLRSKLKSPDFMKMICQCDIVAVQETNLRDYDDFEIPDFALYYQNRSISLTKRRSGGTAFLVKRRLCQYVLGIKGESFLVQGLLISKDLLNIDHDIYCGNVYIPPLGSRFSSKNPFRELQAEIAHCRDTPILLLGDFNARTGSLSDGYPMKRRNADVARPNKYGEQMIEFCKNNALMILNGRFGEDLKSPKPTRHKSAIDYCVSSVAIRDIIQDFSVNDFSRSFSDSHNVIAITIGPC